ncbi:MAG: hypothetical protein JXA46_17200 [Dehalococcoidales bacterium]|nr:hypothetical protein [Dehalococcoidales bacterium]
MIARVTRMKIQTDKIVELKKYFDEGVMPVLKEKEGFRNGYLLVDRKTGDCLTIGIWDNEKGILADEQPGHFQQRLNVVKEFCTAPPVREIYDVVSNY